METPIHNMGKPMRNESEKLKYQTPHHIRGAPTRGAQWNRIHTMEMKEISTVKRDDAESIQWN